MSVLLSGGLGFIGSNLCQMLVESGEHIVVLDNKSSNAVDAIKNSEMMNDTCLNQEAVCRGLQRLSGALDKVSMVHLAAVPGIETCAREPVTSLETNVEGTRVMLEEAVKAGVEHFVFASSVGAVLGTQTQPANEEQIPYPQTVYGWSKLEGERLCWMFANKMRITVLRFTNIYGENSQHKSSIVAKLLMRKLDVPFTIYGDGEQTRDLVYIGDVCRAVVMALEKKAEGLFHIGLGKGIRLLDLVKVVERVTGREIPLKFEAERIGDVRENWTSLDKARNGIGYMPDVEIEEGVRRTWDWAKPMVEQGDKDRLRVLENVRMMRGTMSEDSTTS